MLHTVIQFVHLVVLPQAILSAIFVDLVKRLLVSLAVLLHLKHCRVNEAVLSAFVIHFDDPIGVELLVVLLLVAFEGLHEFTAGILALLAPLIKHL